MTYFGVGGYLETIASIAVGIFAFIGFIWTVAMIKEAFDEKVSIETKEAISQKTATLLEVTKEWVEAKNKKFCRDINFVARPDSDKTLPPPEEMTHE